ncbi:LemA family protein [Marinobacter sp. 1_MG-2023]|uniref:LemA family protein n=1 Tax=Marinobacter sp. 1_MG-2023 TaxID=3062627 RepID=UPI0026E3A743|nr:LemA family protein [Marinobacter sp. 1_MG-2023]MDO6822992.1 LemA family protein [Marinobacter sp. 1_MG-2023]
MKAFMGRSVKRIIIALLALGCLVASWHLMQTGLGQLAQARQMERMPQTPIGALAKGPYILAGQVHIERDALTAPYSNSEAVYYRYKLEEEYRDSDGDLRTRTLDSGQRGTNFQLRDSSGTVTIAPGKDLSAIEWSLERTYRSRTGDKIYSEWALKPGETVRIIGHYNNETRKLTFSGLEDFSLPALISGFTLDIDGGDRMFSAAIRISIATGLLALGVALLLTAAKIHRFWVYVWVMSIAVSGTLAALGVTKLNQEWQGIATLYESRYQQISTEASNPLVLADLAALRQLIHQSTSGWLDRWKFRSLVEKRLPIPELDASTAARAAQIIESQPNGKFQHTWTSWGLSAASSVLAVVLILFAIRAVKLKRLIEAVPTTSTKGLSFGLSELKAMVDVDDAYPPVRDPLRNEKCVAYDYKVEERRGSGKDKKWRTLEHKKERVPFWLEDNEGRALVYPEGANITYPKRHSEIRGNKRYTVRLLDTLVNVYCLGFAGLDREQSDRLALQKDSDSPFLITTQEEDDIVLSRGAGGFAGTAVSLGLFLFAATALLAADGSFSPDNLLLSALTVPLVLCAYLGVLHYNDIVFLKNRVDRARANIDTILQQRHDLWPNLEKAVKASLAHEKELLRTIGQLRSANPAATNTSARIDQLMATEQQVVTTLLARIENYPDLKNNTVIMKFMSIMSETENYLALLRNSHTESVMIYNTRIQSFPDLILAKLFRFRPTHQ